MLIAQISDLHIPRKNTNTVVVKPLDGPYLFEEQDVIRSQQPTLYSIHEWLSL